MKLRTRRRKHNNSRANFIKRREQIKRWMKKLRRNSVYGKFASPYSKLYTP